VRGHGIDRLGEVEPVAELGTFGFLAFDDGLADMAVFVEVFAQADRKSTRLNSSHNSESRMPSSA
jgi:hypothetical protein